MFCTIMCKTFQQSGGRFWPDRHFDGQGRKEGTERLVSGSSFSHDIYNPCFSFVTKGEKNHGKSMETCCLHPVTTDLQKTTVRTIRYSTPLCNFRQVHPQVTFYALEKPAYKLTSLYNTSKLYEKRKKTQKNIFL